MAPRGPDSPKVLTDESPTEMAQADVNRLPEVRSGNMLRLSAGYVMSLVVHRVAAAVRLRFHPQHKTSLYIQSL